MLEHVQIEGLWSDFSVLTPYEDCVSFIEQKLREWKNKPKTRTKIKIQIDKNDFRMVYIPKSYNLVSEITELFDYQISNVQSIREIFGISSDFIIGYFKSQLSDDYIKSAFSILVKASELSGIQIPIFFQHVKKQNLTYSGICFNPKNRMHFTSRTELSVPDSFKSFSHIKYAVSSHFSSKIREMTISCRISSSLNEMDFQNGLYYKNNSFYSTIDHDPIKKIRVFLFYDQVPIDSAKFDILSPDHIAISPSFRKNVKRSNPLRSFIDLFHTACTYESNDETHDKESISDIKAIMSKVFKQPQQLKTDFKCPICGCTPNSSLALLCEKIVEKGTIEAMYVLWKAYIKRVRQYIDNEEPIPGIETDGVNYQHCIIYQKLQMINYCIAHKNAGFLKQDDNEGSDEKVKVNTIKFLLNGEKLIVPERQELSMQTLDQIKAHDNLLEKNKNNKQEYLRLQFRQMKSDIASFKAANPTATFADFIRWYTPINYDDDNNQIRESINPDWQVLWDSTRAEEARKQNDRLFDPVCQIEYAFDELNSLGPGEILPSIISILFELSLYRVKLTALQKMSFVQRSFNQCERAFLSFARRTKDDASNSMEEYQRLCKEPLESLENCAFQTGIVESLIIKLPGCINSISVMLEDGIATITENEKPGLKEFFKKTEFKGRQAATLQAREYTVVAYGENIVSERLFISDRTEKTIIASVTTEPN